jgi:hypothetical protein
MGGNVTRWELRSYTILYDNLKKTEHLEGTGIHGTVIFKRTSRK